MVAAALALAVVSMVSNINTAAQMSGQADVLRAIRLTFSNLANAGVVWAGLLILAGWLVKYPRQAAAAGVAAGLMSLIAHYALGQAAGIYTAEIWEANLNWFFITAIVGAPLGLIGSLAHRADDLGFLARLLVPVGAVAEPLVRGYFTLHPTLLWPDRLASVICGVVLIAAGLLAAFVAVRGMRRGAVQASGSSASSEAFSLKPRGSSAS